jgi:protein-ribulosamine 3-kinase
MLAGEFYSMNLLHTTLPSFSPRPLTIGTFKPSPNHHFYLCEFINLTGGVQTNVTNFTYNLALLHTLSTSPTGKYGFSLPVYGGIIKYLTSWTHTWEEYFTNWMRGLFQQELKAQGPDEEIEYLSERILSKVIPRLLRPMETGGRSIKPVLCHEDLWSGNAGQEVWMGRTVVYDASCFWGHHEGE